MKVASVFSLLILFCFSFFFLCIFFLTSGLVYLSILIMVHFLTNRATFFIFLLFPLRGFCLLCREDSFGTAIKKIQGSPGFFPSSGNKIPLSVQMEKRIFFWGGKFSDMAPHYFSSNNVSVSRVETRAIKINDIQQLERDEHLC